MSTRDVTGKVGKIIGIGVDIERVSRFQKSKMSASLLTRILTEKERKYCYSQPHPEQHIAVRFAAKEAIIKALGESGRDVALVRDLSHIEILRSKKGVPQVRLPAYKGIRAHVSLSHTKGYALAFAVITL